MFTAKCVKSVRVCVRVLPVHILCTSVYACERGERMWNVTFVTLSCCHACMRLTEGKVDAGFFHESLVAEPLTLALSILCGWSETSTTKYASLSIAAMAKTSSLHPSHRFLLLCARSGTISCRSRMFRRTSE